MDKIWFIKVNNGIQEGPFSFLDLRRDRRITPDTLVWKEGFAAWVPIRQVKELKDLFKDDESEKEEEKPSKIKTKEIPGDEELAINLQNDVPPILWLMLILLVLSYLMYRLYGLNE